MERTRHEQPIPVKTEDEYLKQSLLVEPTTSPPVVDEAESTRDEVPSLVEIEDECLKETLTVEPTTSTAVVDEKKVRNTKYQVPLKQWRHFLKRLSLWSPQH